MGHSIFTQNAEKTWPNKTIPLEASLWLRKRGLIESVIEQTKNEMDAVHSRHRAPFNGFANLLAALVAYTFKPQKPTTSINLEARLLPEPTHLASAA